MILDRATSWYLVGRNIPLTCILKWGPALLLMKLALFTPSLAISSIGQPTLWRWPTKWGKAAYPCSIAKASIWAYGDPLGSVVLRLAATRYTLKKMACSGRLIATGTP